MIYRIRIGKIPDGNTPIAGQSFTARRVDTGEALGASVSDVNGFVTFQADGHWPPFYLHAPNVPGGDKFWRSDESHTNGPLCPKELPFVLRAIGDGVVTGYSGLLEVSLSSGGPSVSVAPGAALVFGHPVVFYNFTTLTNTRPQSGTRVDRIAIRLYPEGSTTTPGKADLVVVQGVVDGGSPALPQTTDIYYQSLATLTVPSSGAITLIDDRPFSAGSAAVTGNSSLASFSTTNASGEFITAMNFTLVLPDSVTYDVNVSSSVTQDLGGGMVNVAEVGYFGSGTSPIQFRQPGQLAVDSSGNVLIADTGNARVVKLTSAGALVFTITGLPGLTGVCVDSSSNIYVAGNDPNVSIAGAGFARKYTSAGDLVWTYAAAVPPTEENPGFGYANHCATNGTSLFITCAGSIPSQPHWIVSLDAATGGFSGILAATLNHPISIAELGGTLWTVDTGTNLVSGFGGYTFGIPANARGITVYSGIQMWIAFAGGTVRQYTEAGNLIGQITESDPMGVAAGPGNALWISNYTTGNLELYVLQPPGHGGIAVAINGALATYSTLDISGTIQSSTTTTVAGPTSLLIQLAAKTVTATTSLRNLVLSARAVPRA